jgi:hypothetical protein
MTREELDEILKQVRSRNEYHSAYSYLAEWERTAIISALLPEIKRRIEAAARRDSAA